MIPTLILLGSTLDNVAGCNYVLPADPSGVASAKRQRNYTGPLLTAIRSLTFAQFETFGARVLREIGATDAHITPHGGDQGIDFFGHLSLGRFHSIPPPFGKLAHDVNLSFVGQAKHYPERSLGPDTVRELIGSISLARMRTFSRHDIQIFGGLDLKPFSPSVILLFTTGKLTSGAARLAQSAGIIARSGEQLAVFLADRGVGINHAVCTPAFDQLAFEEWLRNRCE